MKVIIKEQKFFENFFGNERIKTIFSKQIEYMKTENKNIDHFLLNGKPGVGKTTIVKELAKQSGKKLHIIHAQNIKNIKEIEKILFNIKELDILFIDEIHNLKPNIQEIFYNILDDFIYKRHTSKEIIEKQLPRFTIIGATTDISCLNEPFIDRFTLVYNFDEYNEKDMRLICEKILKEEEVEIPIKKINDFIKRSCNNPRKLRKQLILFIHLNIKNLKKNIDTLEINVEEYYDLIKIDINGLNSEEQKIIKILANTDKAIGLNNLACKSGISERILKNKYEPNLIKLDFLVRTFKGRKATDKCKDYKYIS